MDFPILLLATDCEILCGHRHMALIGILRTPHCMLPWSFPADRKKLEHDVSVARDGYTTAAARPKLRKSRRAYAAIDCGAVLDFRIFIVGAWKVLSSW